MLENKVIVITGGSGLLGREIICELLKQSAIVISLDINYNKMTTVNQIQIDVTDEVSVKMAIDQIILKYGRIDGWVNNAYPRTKDWGNKVEDVSMDSWRRNIDCQLNSYFMCCKLVLDEMKQKGSGCVINMASIYGIVAPDFSIYEGTNMTMPVAYSAIKGGLISLTKYLAAYYGPNGLRVNSISPGGVQNDQDIEFTSKYIAKTPLKRMAKATDIAPSVCFLLSEKASYITGHNLVIDGGWSII